MKPYAIVKWCFAIHKKNAWILFFSVSIAIITFLLKYLFSIKFQVNSLIDGLSNETLE